MILKGISKVNEFVDPELLQDSEVTELKNLVIDGGVAKKRGAIKSYNTSSSGGTIKDLFGLGDDLLGLVDVGGTRTLKKFSSGTWSSLKTGLSDVGIFGALKDDKLFLTNGTDEPFGTDGSTTWDIPISSPDLSSTTTAVSSGGDLEASKVYRYAFAYITDKGEVGDYSVIGHYLSGSDNTTDGTYKTVDFTDLPVSSRADVTGRRVFRTEGSGLVFYYLTDIDNTSTTFSDSSADTLLDTSETLPYSSSPTKADQIAIHRDRLFLGGVTVDDRSVVKPPTVSIAVTTDDSDTRNTWAYAVTYLDSYGNESIISTSGSVSTHGTTGWTNTITYIPKPMVGAGERDTSIVAIKLYRSENGGDFKWIKNIDHTNADWSHNLPYLSTTDSALTAGDSYSAPPSTTYSNRIYYSEIDKFGQINVLNYVDIYPQDNEDIIGMVDQEDGLLVLKEKSICFVYTSGSPYNWRVVKLIENIGCTNKTSIQRAKNAVYFQYNNDIYRFPDMKIISQEFNNTLDGITINDTAYVSKYNWYVIVSNSKMYIYDERNGTWLYFTPDDTSYSSATETIDGDFYIGHLILMKYDTSTSLDYNESREADEDTISSSLKSKHYISTPNQEFRLRKLFSLFNKGSGSVTEKLVDPVTSGYRSVTHSGTGWKTLKQTIDGMTGSLKTSHSIRYEISGDIVEFNSMRIESNMRNRNRVWS